MTNYTNKTLLRDRKMWRIKQIDELDDGELDEQKCTQKIEILPWPTKKWRIKQIGELDEFYCICKLQEAMQLHFINLMLPRVHKTSTTFIQFIQHNKMKGIILLALVFSSANFN